MAFSGIGRVTVVSLASGQPLPKMTAESSQAILNEPAIITLLGSPSQVSSYQQHGEDLILNLQNSDALRYQNFFTQTAGRQSELYFQQENLLQQALFSDSVPHESHAFSTLKPVWHSPGSTTSLTEREISTPAVAGEHDSSPHTSPALAPVAAGARTDEASSQSTPASEASLILAAAPPAEPAERSTLISSATSDAVATTVATIPLPALTLDPVTGDNAVSYQEGMYGILFSGSASHLPSGTPIELTIDGKTWLGSVYQDRWQVQLSDSDVKTIKDGNYTLAISATDQDGNGTSLSQELLLITHYNSSNPQVTVNDITLADVVQHDGQSWYTLSGTLNAPLPLESFAVQVSDTFHWNDAEIYPDGSWRAEISADELYQGGNNLMVGVMDGAGNWFEQSAYVNLDLTTPVDNSDGGEAPPATGDNPTDGDPAMPGEGETPPPAVTGPVSFTINNFTGDAVLSADEKLSAQTLSGTSQNLAAESTLTIKLNGEIYTTTLAADGSWSVTFPAIDLQALPVGANRISVTFDNSVGGTTTASKNITVEASAPPPDAPLPQPTIEAPFGDGQMNAHERYEPHTLQGTTGVVGTGQKITLLIDGVSYAGTVDNEGYWRVPLTAEQLREVEWNEGTHEIVLTVTDVWGQTGTAERTFITDTSEPALRIATLAGDGVIDATEINSPLIISGTSEAGSTIDVTFGSVRWSGTADQSGHWQFPVPAETLQNMDEGSYNVVARATDSAGNTRSGSASVQIFASEALPQLTLDPVTGDNAVSYQEGMYGILFTGSAAHLPSGTPIALTIDGRTWQGSVYRDQWQVQLSDSEVKTIQDGNYTVTVSATDQRGNGTSLSQELLLITHYNSSIPQVTVNDITLADVVQHDGQSWYTLSGTLNAPLPLESFAVQVSDTFHWNDAEIYPDGSWRAEISADELYQGGNNLMIGVMDGAGNWFEQSAYVNLDLTTPVDSSSVNAVALVSEDNPTEGAIAASPLDKSDEQATLDLTAERPDDAANSGSDTHIANEVNSENFSLSSLHLVTRADDSAGHDTPPLAASHEALDFALLGLKTGENQMLDLRTFSSDSMTQGQKDRLLLSDSASDTLPVKGTDGNLVTLSTTEEGVWNSDIQRGAEGQHADAYSVPDGPQGSLADILIQHNLHVQLV